MLGFFRPPNDNEWTRADRWERLKSVATLFIFCGLTLAGLALLLYALTA